MDDDNMVGTYREYGEEVSSAIHFTFFAMMHLKLNENLRQRCKNIKTFWEFLQHRGSKLKFINLERN